MRAIDIPMAVTELNFEDGATLAEELATRVAEQLSTAVAARGSASLAVSGGSTPKAFFAALAGKDIDWANVTITLVDDRLVPPDHDRSNERMVRSLLLQKKAAAARFVPLWSAGEEEPSNLAARAAAAIDAIELPFDVVVLGMGTDGHTASFFPCGTNLAQAIDPQCSHSVIDMEAPGAGEPRLTITLPRLVEARLIVLQIEGEEKRRVFEKARAGGTPEEMPIRAVLRHAPSPVTVYWAP